MTLYKNFKFQISNFKFQTLLLTAYYLLLTASCYAESKSITVTTPANKGMSALNIAAASDLSFVLKELSSSFEKDTGIKVGLSFGSTGMLAKQIENGAPFDVFFAADVRHVDDLRDKGLVIADTQRMYAQGRIVLAVNKKSGIKIERLDDLLNPSVKRIVIANPDHAPYGIAAKEAMIKAGVWDRLKYRIVYAENIRQAVQFIQTGDAHAGIVAISLSVNMPDIIYTVLGSNLHNPINQTLAVIKNTKAEKEVREFINYATGQKGREIMQRYGFILP